MPLNPEEVVNKRFSPTKFRQGYDEEEVDEFLDEVVAELRRLNAENDELRSKLSACESRVSELSRGADRGPAGDAGEPVLAARGTGEQPAAEPVAEPTAEPVAEPAPAPAAAPAAAAAPVAGAGSAASEPESAAGMLALAQRLHDEHVQAGKDERTKIVNEARETAARLVRDAEERQRETLGNLEQQRQVLERKVDQLRSFEREYRARLKAYLETQLRELETQAPVAGSAASGSAGAGSGASADGGQAASGGPDTPRFPFGG